MGVKRMGDHVSRLIIIALILVAAAVPTRPAAAQDTCFTLPASYRSDELHLAAVLMKPVGIGPFPAVVFNHSSKVGRELQPTVEDGTPCFRLVSERHA